MNNHQAFEKAQQLIPGGVNSPVRSFNSVGGEPFFTQKAKDCYLYDIEGNEYIDYVCSWGANITGHANSYLIEKVSEALHQGFSYGTPTLGETKFAETIIQLLPSIEKFRLVSSGTEAVMSAIRLARGYTRKQYIIKFNGCYHGHSDALLIKAGSGLQTLANPSSAGVTSGGVEHTLVLEYNDTEQLVEAFKLYPKQIAAVIVEPFAGNMNLVRPDLEFIHTLRRLCDEYASVLIFDEVMTGFRVALGGAQQLLNIKPDLTILGKVIGGGMPLAGFGGKAQIMDHLAPIGDVYQAGTLSGNPIAVAAGLANLYLIQKPGFYDNLNKSATQLTAGLNLLGNKYELALCADSVGGMLGIYFNDQIPRNFTEVKMGNDQLFRKFFHLMLKHGVFFAPSRFEAGFICDKHNEQIISKTLAIADMVCQELVK